MKYRKLTLEESFPLSFQKSLQKNQSDHFVNNTLANGLIKKGYENFPIAINLDNDSLLVIDSNPPKFLIGTYINNHWRVILASVVLGGLLYYGIESQMKSTKKNTLK